MQISTGFHCSSLNPDFVLEFLCRLKQANTLKWLTLFVSTSMYFRSRAKFHQDVVVLIQQINHTRAMKSIDPLELDIDDD